MNAEEKQLDTERDSLEKMENKTEETVKRISNCKQKLKGIREKSMEGFILGSRARWIADGEKRTNYFCNLEKRHNVSKSMSRLINQHNKILDNQKDIVEEVKQFYERLYQHRKNEKVNLKSKLEGLNMFLQLTCQNYVSYWKLVILPFFLTVEYATKVIFLNLPSHSKI